MRLGLSGLHWHPAGRPSCYPGCSGWRLAWGRIANIRWFGVGLGRLYVEWELRSGNAMLEKPE